MSMKISRKKFIIIFLIAAFIFQFISNALLGPEVRLFPVNGDWFPGTGSSITWKNTLATIIYPVKIILLAPLSPLFTDPDPPPPILLFAFAIYWSVIAWILHFILSKICTEKKAKF